MRYGYGIDIGGTTVKLAYFDESGKLLEAWEIPTVTENGGSRILPDIAAAVKAHRATHPGEAIIGIGVGVPGPVDGNGQVLGCVNLGWGAFNIARELEALTELPVRAGNDANVAAMGENWKGGGAGYENMVMATLGTGVGGGIVLGGKLLHGTHGAGGEIGHMVLDPKETEVCGCGKRGCVEQFCSATGLARLAKKRLLKDDAPSSLRSIPAPVSKDIFDAGKAGDPVALEILEQFYDYLGQFLGSLCSVLDPQVVVLGGGVSKAGRILTDGIRPYFQKYAFKAVAGIPITIAELGNDAGAYGAFKLALDAFG